MAQRVLTRRRFLSTVGGALAANSFAAVDLPAVREYRRNGMVYRALGATDLYTSLLSIGSHTDGRYGTPSGLSLEGQARRDRLLRRAFDLGCNLLDVYPKQLEAAARHARGRRDKVLISLSLNPRTELDMALRLFGYVDL